MPMLTANRSWSTTQARHKHFALGTRLTHEHARAYYEVTPAFRSRRLFEGLFGDDRPGPDYSALGCVTSRVAGMTSPRRFASPVLPLISRGFGNAADAASTAMRVVVTCFLCAVRRTVSWPNRHILPSLLGASLNTNAERCFVSQFLTVPPRTRQRETLDLGSRTTA